MKGTSAERDETLADVWKDILRSVDAVLADR